MKILRTLPGFQLGILILLSLLVALPAFAAGTKHPRKQKTPLKQEVVVPPAPAPEPTPQTLAQMPAVPAQVTYRGNQLTITARNSTMGDILRLVQKQTGATMDFPPNAAERVVGQFGPGPARDVLASLFQGSNFNYVLLGSASDPTGVQRVIVTVRPAGPDFSPAPPQSQQPNRAAYQPPQPQFPTASDDDQQPSESFAPEPATPDQSVDQDSDSDSNSDSDGQPNGTSPGIRTPEQLLQELQRQQQLQEQQQQNGAQPPHSARPQ